MTLIKSEYPNSWYCASTALLPEQGSLKGAVQADVCVIGNEEQVNAQLDALAAAGTTDFSAVELALNPEDMARTRALLAERATTVR